MHNIVFLVLCGLIPTLHLEEIYAFWLGISRHQTLIGTAWLDTAQRQYFCSDSQVHSDAVEE